MKKVNAARLEEERREEMLAQGLDPEPPQKQDHEKTPYPKYAEFEVKFARSWIIMTLFCPR